MRFPRIRYIVLKCLSDGEWHEGGKDLHGDTGYGNVGWGGTREARELAEKGYLSVMYAGRCNTARYRMRDEGRRLLRKLTLIDGGMPEHEATRMVYTPRKKVDLVASARDKVNKQRMEELRRLS